MFLLKLLPLCVLHRTPHTSILRRFIFESFSEFLVYFYICLFQLKFSTSFIFNFSNFLKQNYFFTSQLYEITETGNRSLSIIHFYAFSVRFFTPYFIFLFSGKFSTNSSVWKNCKLCKKNPKGTQKMFGSICMIMRGEYTFSFYFLGIENN